MPWKSEKIYTLDLKHKRKVWYFMGFCCSDWCIKCFLKVIGTLKSYSSFLKSFCYITTATGPFCVNQRPGMLWHLGYIWTTILALTHDKPSLQHLDHIWPPSALASAVSESLVPESNPDSLGLAIALTAWFTRMLNYCFYSTFRYLLVNFHAPAFCFELSYWSDPFAGWGDS